MRNSRTGFVVLLLVAGIALAQTPAPAPSQEPSVKLPAELDRVLRDYEAAWRAKDAAGLAKLFTEDGFVLSGGRPPARGREAIQQRYTGAGGPLALRAMAFATSGDVGYIIGAYSGTEGRPDEGKYTLTLRKGADGRWLIMSDMDNLNRPPRQAQAPGSPSN
jgi:ketosteroid isomerase-like protein